MKIPDRSLDHLRMTWARPELPGHRYEVGDLIAEGGMGAVWRARDRTLDRDVALKVLTAARPDDAARERMMREARILARLEHPGIVPVHDVGVLADGRSWYTMKLVQGSSLDRHLASVPELSRRLSVFERVCEAVAFAHAHGVIHRDLKPQNIMVGPFGEVLVMDWGVAKLRETAEVEPAADTVLLESPVAGATVPGTVLGTPGYMAPEQAAGRAHLVDERSDVYSLGALLPTVVAPGGTKLPARLEAVRRRATADRPEDRYPDVGALATDIRAVLDGTTVSAYRESPWEVAARVFQRHRTAFLLLFVYVLVRTLVFLFAST